MFGLILTGGGARGAYQVGVLKAVSEISPKIEVPFPVLSGVSVGALNVAGLASNFENFQKSVTEMEEFWRGLKTHKVLDTRFFKILFSGIKFLLCESFPGLIGRAPNSLLDITPLKNALIRDIDFDKISEAVDSRSIHAVGITCSEYSTGHAVTFFDSASTTKEWSRTGREGQKCHLRIDHIMASSALPLLFPAAKITCEYYGDGALRLTSPLAPGIHLGATRLLTIGTRDKKHIIDCTEDMDLEPPSLSDLGGFVLDTIFYDNLAADIERLERINNTLTLIDPAKKHLTKLKPIKILAINPSRRLKEIAIQHKDEMPRSLRWLLRRQGKEHAAGRLESYLLFEPSYIGALIDLGYSDAMARKKEIIDFLKD